MCTNTLYVHQHSLYGHQQHIVCAQVNKALEEKGQAALPSMEIAVLERIDSLLDLRESQSAQAAAPLVAKPSVWGWAGKARQ
jgi:hypothetical protein